MDINKINPAGYGQDYEVTGETRADAKRQTNFPVAVGSVESSASPKTLKALAQFGKADLSDPRKLDGAIRACAAELVDSGQRLTGRMSVADKQATENFLASDPTFRQQIESYLQKTLT
jgi:hypothetical protein